MDVKTAFLNGPLKEEFMLLARRVRCPDHPGNKFLPSKESFVGIKAKAQEPGTMNYPTFLMSKGFTKGLQIHQSPKGIFINQAKYALEILKKHNMDNCHSIGTPLATKPKLDVDLSGEPVHQSDYRSKIRSLMYLTSSRPDLVQAVCYCARYQARPTQKHLKEVKRIFKYLKGTINMGLWYPKDSGFELTAFSDADHAGCLDTRKSTSGGIQFLGDKLVSWMSKKQNCTAMSLAEAEYVALSASCAQHSKTKHIHTRYHFIKEQVENGIIELYFVRTEYQLADMFTKALPEDRFKYLVRRIGMRCLTPAELEVIRLGINPMIQPEPEDLPKDNPKLEIAVLRIAEFKVFLMQIAMKCYEHTQKGLLIQVQHQRRVNPKIHDVIKKEVEKLLDAGLIYPISDSPWVSPVHCVPKKGGMTVVTNEENELVPTRLVTGWRVCIDYRKLNEATCKDHFPLPFMDQMLERLAGNEFYCFLDGFSGYFQIPIDPKDQEKTTFTCPYETFAYRRMPFGLCNAPGTFQRCMMAIFHDMIEKTMEVFMDDFSVFGDSFSSCLANLDKMLKRCENTKLALNWEKSHFMVKESIVLGHKISRKGIEVDKAKVDVISKLPHPTTVKGIRSFLGHAGFYRRFIKDFSKIS
ncbi:reverse transcriptase domain-containing protein [Tanacetum coccineum]|uniref:Reverse transcriptase domain-containing protein n=1 Tax=Tanacetum coccineum TaxID=301880 RepID=A0ABQ4Z8G8_9ASTR